MLKITNKTNFLGFAAAFISVLITAIITWVLYMHTVSLLTDNLHQRLSAMAITGSIQFDWKDIEVLKKEADWKKQSWVKVVNQLKKIRVNNQDIIFAYILRKSPDQYKIEFVSDSHSINPYANTDNDPTNDVDVDSNGVIDATDKLQWPGQIYEDPPKEVFDAYNGPVVTKNLYQDEYGTFLTGYAPIKDDQNKTIAVLGVDVRVNEFFTITRQTLYPFIAFIIFLIAIIFILAKFLITIWNKQITIVKETDRQKDELLSMVSHQLATPISSVKYYIEMLMDGDLGALQKEQKESLGTMASVIADLSDLVSMILDVSRIQLGRVKVTKQEFHLGEFFKEILLVIEPKAKEKNINFIKSISASLPMVSLDKKLLHMTVENLLSNAVKYTPEKGDVELTVRIENGKFFCSVKDNGCGIPKKDQDKIFGKLYRASNVTSVQGNGFGLYIAKGGIENQGGKIWFTSEEGKGTTFAFEVPIHD